MPAQRTAGGDQRSAFPQYTGVPWWGAVVIAVIMTLAGLAVEAGSGHQELGTAFAIGYSLGCVGAVLAVRRSGIFTAVIQPPLLLFVAVPLAYYLFHNSSFSGLKEVAISCGYPLIERFPLMLFTSSAVLLIGLIRWYLAMAHPGNARDAAPAKAGLLGGLSTKLSSAFAGNGSVDERPGQRAARPRHVVDRPESGRRRRPEHRTSTRSRSGRPIDDPSRPRREQRRRPAEEFEYDEPRRRTREPREPRDPRRTPPPPRREPRERREYRDDYPPRPARGSRYDPYETGPGYQSHPAYQPYPPEPRRRPAPTGSSGTHHPVSRVRYRSSDPSDTDYRDEPRPRR
jgi:hypothetical protein